MTMTQSTPKVAELKSLSRAERAEALEELVVAEFKATLLMNSDEELPLDQSYFELGFTSLRITEIKERLENVLDCGISTSVLFNSPTVNRLLEYLISEVLTALFTD